MFKERRARWYATRIAKDLQKLRRLGYELVRVQTNKNDKIQVWIEKK